jgi:UDP-glucose 4-epimerase
MNEERRRNARRVLVTGLSSYWGGRLAEALESFPEIEVIIGVDTREPTRELERTEYVKVGNQHSLIQRIVQAAEIDTVIDTRLVVDAIATSRAEAHENNVIGTLNILAACAGVGSPVRKLIIKSSPHWYGCEQDDPAFFTEEMQRQHPPRTAIERDIVEAEAAVADFGDKNRDLTVTVLRCANVLGPDVDTSHTRMFSLPVVPMIFGFDPRYQFVHEDDVVHALEHVTLNEFDGIYNVAADGVLALSEVISLLGKRPLPILPPWGTGLAVEPLRRLGFRVPDEMLNQLRFGRGLDNRKLKATGFDYRYTTLETVAKLREHMRLDPILRGVREPYQYERDVEDFLRRSPHVRHNAEATGHRPKATEVEGQRSETEGQRSETREAPPVQESPPIGEPQPAAPPVEHYDDLEAEEIISLLGSLEARDLEALLEHEAGARGRASVIAAIEAVLARRATGPRPSMG